MTDKPEIKVGQKWVTREGDTVRVLAVDGKGTFSVVGQFERTEEYEGWCADGFAYPDECDRPDGNDLISLAPTTVKRTVALYGFERNMLALDVKDTDSDDDEWRRISEALEIEFTLLPGEIAE